MSKSIFCNAEMTVRERFLLLISPFLLLIANIVTLEYIAPVCGVERFGLFDRDLTSHRCLESARIIFILSAVGLIFVCLNFFVKKYKFFVVLQGVFILLALANILIPIIGPGACMMPGMVCRKHSFPLTNTFSAILIFNTLWTNLLFIFRKKSKEFKG